MDFLGRFVIGFVLGPVLVFAAILGFSAVVDNPWLLLWPLGIFAGLVVIVVIAIWLGARRPALAPDREPLPPASLSPPQPDAPPPMTAARRAEHAHWRRDYRGWQFKSPRK
ncbi:MAG: hypothetical protein RL490_216 [Pseudomonadota bacterium]|jgi:hypothetical protein